MNVLPACANNNSLNLGVGRSALAATLPLPSACAGVIGISPGTFILFVGRPGFVSTAFVCYSFQVFRYSSLLSVTLLGLELLPASRQPSGEDAQVCVWGCVCVCVLVSATYWSLTLLLPAKWGHVCKTLLACGLICEKREVPSPAAPSPAHSWCPLEALALDDLCCPLGLLIWNPATCKYVCISFLFNHPSSWLFSFCEALFHQEGHYRQHFQCSGPAGAPTLRVVPSPPDTPLCSAARRLLMRCKFPNCFTHAHTHTHICLFFTISICGYAIYLASGECPSATLHNISHKYHLSTRGSWNIYEKNMAAAVFGSVYREHRKVQQVLCNFYTGSHLVWATAAPPASAP